MTSITMILKIQGISFRLNGYHDFGKISVSVILSIKIMVSEVNECSVVFLHIWIKNCHSNRGHAKIRLLNIVLFEINYWYISNH